MAKINTMRTDLSADIAKILSDNLAVDADPDHIQAMKPIIMSRAEAKAKLVKLSMDNVTEDANLVDRIKAYSDAEFEAGVLPKQITHKTFKSYVARMSTLQTLITGTKSPLDIRNFIDSARVMTTVNTGSLATGELWALGNRVSYLGALDNISRKFSILDEAHKVYHAQFNIAKTLQTADRSNNTSTIQESSKFVHWPVIVSRLKSIETSGEFTSKQVALLSLYVSIPPRRVTDYSLMRITYSEPADLTQNWLVLNAQHRPKWMQINRYKTDGKYGQYTLKTLPEPFRNNIQAYLIDADLGEGDPLFGTNAGRLMSASAFSSMVGKMSESVFERRVTVNIFRHSKITDYLRNGRLTVAQKQTLATAMAHSVAMQDLYRKVDQDPDAIDIDSDDEGEEVTVLKVKSGGAAAAAKPADVKPAVAAAKPKRPKNKKSSSKPIPETPQQPAKKKRGPPNPRGRK
jgi:hypothetical protein